MSMTTHDLAELTWSLRGFTPYQWGWGRSMETGLALVSELPPVPARVPGSVQGALRAAGLIPDWRAGLNARECEWIEHRHWLFEAQLPDTWVQPGCTCRLRCLGLDGNGWVLVNGTEVGTFANTFVPHVFQLTAALRAADNRLQIIFDCPPRWLGQFGYTSQMTAWKPRFNYTWDWQPRLVQIGIWDALELEVAEPAASGDAGGGGAAAGSGMQDTGSRIQEARCWTNGDCLHVVAPGAGRLRLTLSDGQRVLRTGEFEREVVWRNLRVARWWPNGQGAQPLYTVTCAPVDSGGSELRTWRVGFKRAEWRQCLDAPAGADPWLCAVNGKPIFLQGVNWTPILPNFADASEADYRLRLSAYRDMGCNVLRVWGGAVLEKELFYDLCDELGLLVWQEFPLSSSGLENWPPEDPEAIADLTGIAASYIARRQHHVSLLLWCGGNELQGSLDGSRTGVGKPVDGTHPLMARLNAVVAEMDPGRRFLPTSASGPRFVAREEDFGKGLHWDVHGPWSPAAPEYWAKDDALFRSEVGAPGASSAAIIREFAGNLPELPASLDNPLWRRTSWWIQWPEFLKEKGREPRDLAEFVAWSQQQQADALALAVRTCKQRFPRCGGVILWMGHDAFPCTANTAVLDMHGQPKPAALAVGELFRGSAARDAQDAKRDT